MEQEQSSEMYSHRIGPEVTEQVEFGAFRKLGIEQLLVKVAFNFFNRNNDIL
jgi:hypothetical protein